MINKDDTVQFIACKHLDYETHYIAKMALISVGSTTKVCWERRDPEGRLRLCQFCKKRGRLNDPTACLSQDKAKCNLYELTRHTIGMENINL